MFCLDKNESFSFCRPKAKTMPELTWDDKLEDEAMRSVDILSGFLVFQIVIYLFRWAKLCPRGSQVNIVFLLFSSITFICFSQPAHPTSEWKKFEYGQNVANGHADIKKGNHLDTYAQIIFWYELYRLHYFQASRTGLMNTR